MAGAYNRAWVGMLGEGAMIEWRPEMSVGHPDIDSDHKHLVEVINAFEAAAGREASEAVLGATMLRLQDFVIDHFSREEAIQRAADYPLYDEHKREHDALVERLTDFARTYFILRRRPVDREVVAAFARFLREWVINHTLGADLRMKGRLTPRKSRRASPAAPPGGR
ncbi:MAG: bacteriohemerythrin [Pseudomonadota bacterium]